MSLLNKPGCRPGVGSSGTSLTCARARACVREGMFGNTLHLAYTLDGSKPLPSSRTTALHVCHRHRCPPDVMCGDGGGGGGFLTVTRAGNRNIIRGVPHKNSGTPTAAGCRTSTIPTTSTNRIQRQPIWEFPYRLARVPMRDSGTGGPPPGHGSLFRGQGITGHSRRDVSLAFNIEKRSAR